MAFHYNFLLLFLIFPFLNSTNQTPLTNQSQFFTLLNNSLKGNLFSYWNLANPISFCNFTGIICDNHGFVTKIDFTGWSLSGHFPENICYYLPKLRILRLSHNNFRSKFPTGITNCSLLEELSLNSAYFSGILPDFSPLTSLRILDLSYNYFSGDFPISATNLTNLEELNFNENGGFNLWKLPEDISRLTKLKTMVLTTCMLDGFIPRSIGNMTELVDLELSGNFLIGKIPKELGFLKNLKQLELYYNQLEGEIPEELGNLTELIDLDFSVNKLSGNIPEAICRLPKLQVLQLYNNSLNGEIPETISNSTTLTTLSLYDNLLSGQVPRGLGRSCPLIILELSENRFTGSLPAEGCNLRKLQYYLVLDNMFSGEVPREYENCESILRFRVNNNRLEGSVPEGLFALPHVSIIDLSNNRLNGSISDKIGNARNLSEFFIQSNKISGVLPREISRAANLVKIDLSDNILYGPIPSEMGNLRRLNVLMLQGNKLNSTIPNSISLLKSLNVLDLSNNKLTGEIPISLSELLPNWMNFSDNLLTGPIPISFIKGGLVESFSGNPGLCVTTKLNSSDKKFPICGQSYNQKKINCVWVIGISVGFVIIGFLLFLKRLLNKEDSSPPNDEASSSSFFSYDIKSFHKINFDQREIIEKMVDKNIVGHGGSGTVYRVELSSGEIVAIKKLWTRKTKDFVSEDQILTNREMKTEVDTLGSVRHKNIVKLYSYFSSLDCNLLIYEYMPNGNLWDTLHRGKIVLDWPTRHQIGLGVAQGLAYLHHDLKPSIIHRDIKSTNILLDINYQPKVADFGIAKVLQARGGKDSSTTVIAGTYGYLAPEYAYSSKAMTKCDVYSFGVVLMELITGRKPLEPEFGENKNIIYWISTKVDCKEGAMEVLDKRISASFKEEMIKVLKIAIRCTYKAPANRPNMSEVVQLLCDADPCKFEKYKSSNKSKETTNSIKPKDPYD